MKSDFKKEVSIMGEHNCYKIDVAEGTKKKTYDFWIERCREQDHDMDYWLNTEKTLRVQIKK